MVAAGWSGMIMAEGLYKAKWNTTYYGPGYATKNNYEVYETHDLRSGKDVVTTETKTLYGNAERISVASYLKILVTGEDGDILPKLPQLMVFGSGLSDPGWGSKADPDRPVTVIDYAAFEAIMGLVMTGMEVPDLKGADLDKIPEFLEKIRQTKTPDRDGVIFECETCGEMKQGEKKKDTAGTGVNPSKIKKIPFNEYHH